MASGDYLQNSLSKSALTGKQLGPYTIQTLIAQGGMGAVYLAFHQQLHRQVALKTMHPSGEDSPEETQRFINEARILARINHPNVVPLYDAGESAGTRWIAMEWVRGKSLHELLRERGQLNVEEAVSLIRDVAAGLQEAHRLGILHRDLKPANILVDAEGVPRLTDFGVARAAEDERLTKTGMVMGTPNYMAPEQAQGLKDVDVRVDVYGLVAVLYELLTGRPPFNKPSQLATLQAVVAEPLELPRSIRPELSRDVEAVVLAGMRKDRAKRYQDLGQLTDDLERLLEGEPVSVRQRGPGARVYQTIRRRGLLLATIVIVLVGFTILGLAAVAPALRDRSEERLAQDAVAWRDTRLAELDAEIATASGSRLTELTDSLQPAWLMAGAEQHLAVATDAKRAAIRRGLGGEQELNALLDPLRGRALLRLADESTGELRLARLAEASVLDEGEAGREALLGLARALRSHPTQASRRLASRTLLELVAGEGRPAAAARLELAGLRADELEFLEAAAIFGPPEAHAGSPGVRRVAALSQLLRGRSSLPAHTAATVVPTPAGPLLVLGNGAAVTTYRLEPGDEAGELVSVSRWTLAGQRIHHVTSARWGDELELIVVGHDAKTAQVVVTRFSPEIPSGSPLGQGSRVQLGSRIAAVTEGEFNGDGKLDLAVIGWDPGNTSFVLLGGASPAGVQLFATGQGSQPLSFILETAVAADLDGDGRDELLIGQSVGGGSGVMALGFDPQLRKFVGRGGVATGYVRRLIRASTDRVLALVDYGDESFYVPSDPGRPWLGRDGVYVLGGDDAGSLTLSGRWTLGEDSPSSSADRQRTGDVGAMILPLEGEPWLVRSWREAGDTPLHVEALPLAKLSGAANPKAELSLLCLEPPTSWSTARALTLDLDGDGQPEALLERLLLGTAQGIVPSAPQPVARLGRSQRLLRAVRQLRALDCDAKAEHLVERLRTRFPESWAARSATLERVDTLTARAAAAKVRARRAFRRLDAEVGRQELDQANALFSRAAKTAETLAREAKVDVTSAWFKAAHAWQAADQPQQALRTLRQLYAEGEDFDEETRARLARTVAELTTLPTGEALEIRLGAESSRGRVTALTPLRTRFQSGALSLPTTGACADGAFVALDMNPQPLAVEAELEPLGPAWQALLQVGVFENEDDQPVRPTGFQLSLWNVITRKMQIQPLVRGQRAGPAVEWPRYDDRLVIRVEARPRVGGGTHVRLTIRDPAGSILFDDERPSSVAPPEARTRGAGSLFAGALCPVGNDVNSLTYEQRAFPMSSRVLLDRLTLQTGSSIRLNALPPLLNAHALLAAEDPSAAAAYTPLLESRDPRERFEAYWYRGFARGRQGDARAHEDVVAATALDPYAALLRFEDLALETLLDRPLDLGTVGAALRQLAKTTSPTTQQLVGRQLLGELDLLADPAQGRGASDQTARIYASMRRISRSSQERYSWVKHYKKLEPRGRYPRAFFPQVFAPSDGGLDEATYAALLDVEDDLRGAYVAACKAWYGKPERVEAPIRLAEIYMRQNAAGTARGVLLPLLRRDLSERDRRRVLYSLARTYYYGGQREAFLDTASELVEAGLPPEDLSEFAKGMQGDPRFQALMKGKN